MTGAEILQQASLAVWLEARRLPGGSRSDLHRLMREMDICCCRNPERFQRAENEFEAHFSALDSVPSGPREPERVAFKRRVK